MCDLLNSYIKDVSFTNQAVMIHPLAAQVVACIHAFTYPAWAAFIIILRIGSAHLLGVACPTQGVLHILKILQSLKSIL